MKFFIPITLLLISCAFSTTLSAQLKETLHQTFDIDEANTVSINLPNDVEMIKWAGNTVMAEIYVELTDARPSILRYYVEAGRYEILGNPSGDTFTLSAKDPVRRTIRYKDLECYEFVKVKLFYPDVFDMVNETTLVRQEEEDAAAVDNR